MRRTLLLAATGFLAGAAAASAQQVAPRPAAPEAVGPAGPATTAPEPRFSDRILAVVGDHLLLESEWQEQTVLLAEQTGLSPGSPGFDALARDAFDQMVRDLVIVAAAERDTAIMVDEEQVIAATDRDIDRIRQRFPSEEEFLRQLRQSQWGSLAAYRADLQDRKRRELLAQAYLETHGGEIRPPPVSDDDVRRFWDENRALFGARPETVLFEEIPIVVRPSGAARDSALAKAERVLAELRAGGDFAVLARAQSDDPGSRERGGDLGWFGHGRMVPAFEQAAFGATVGELVGPVETSYGYHLLQVVDRRGEEVRARHILIGFERTDEDRDRAREEAEVIVVQIADGADVDSLQIAYLPGDSAGVAIVELPVGELPPAYGAALDTLAPGQSAIVETATGFSVVVGRGRGGGGDVMFEEAAPQIRRELAQRRAEEAFVERLREQVYVDVRVRPEELNGR